MAANPTVLLADDEPADVLMMQRAVRKLQLPILLQTVKNGEEAIDYLSGSGPFGDRNRFPMPKLILLDIKMPRKTGFDVLEWIKFKPAISEVPIVMVTASDVPADIERAYALGAKGYLVKPVSIETLRKLFLTTEEFLEETRHLVS